MNLQRETRETRIDLSIDLQAGESVIDTRARFLDHMLGTLSRYAGWTLRLRARGDLVHYTIEDVAITLGLAIRDAAPRAVARFGHRVVAMDDALVAATLDAGGSAYYEGPLPSAFYDHFSGRSARGRGWRTGGERGCAFAISRMPARPWIWRHATSGKAQTKSSSSMSRPAQRAGTSSSTRFARRPRRSSSHSRSGAGFDPFPTSSAPCVPERTRWR